VAEAVIVNVPAVTPVSVGCRVGVVLPALKETELKFSVALPLLGVSVTVTGPLGAVAKVTGNETALPGAIVNVEGTIIESA
jgi:hypothetical protein